MQSFSWFPDESQHLAVSKVQYLFGTWPYGRFMTYSDSQNRNVGSLDSAILLHVVAIASGHTWKK